MKKKIIAWVIASIFLLCPLSVLASSGEEETVDVLAENGTPAGLENIPAKSYILMEQSTGKELLALDVYKRQPLSELKKDGI